MKKLLLVVLAVMTTSVIAHEKGSIADAPELVTPLMPGVTAPNVVLWSENGQPVKLHKLAAAKPTIVVFYRGGWCPYCNAQLKELQGVEAQLESLGYQLIALSPELPDRIKAMQSERQLGYQLMSDFQIQAAKGFGIAFRMKDKTATLYKERLDAQLQKHDGEQKFNLPVPAVFVLDQEAMVRFSYANPNYKVRLHPELLVKAAELALEK